MIYNAKPDHNVKIRIPARDHDPHAAAHVKIEFGDANLPAEAVSELVRKHGLQSNVTVYQQVPNGRNYTGLSLNLSKAEDTTRYNGDEYFIAPAISPNDLTKIASLATDLQTTIGKAMLHRRDSESNISR